MGRFFYLVWTKGREEVFEKAGEGTSGQEAVIHCGTHAAYWGVPTALDIIIGI